MSTREIKLSTTSYAMLGMLALRPWTTYELAKQVGRGLGQFWPRARSNLFGEPKKLVAGGLATATEDRVGRRPRTVYTITPDGHQALERWLATPGEGPVLEFEEMLKVFFADHGTKADAVAAIQRIKRWAAERNSENIGIARSYVEGTAPFPERAAVLALTGRFLTNFADMVGEWADWAGTVVADWPEDVRCAEPKWDVLADIARRLPTD
ncbi:PadR family transcriptional regulator [Mycobacterium colombiense]|uniref:PadR family transcriptional regulator n=1 Tax=Mycobacterium colombiense TaxID=339268 RepID=UPI0007FE3110|nr:PadR family transcriptional regulator [Mycobacterium colombiense]OBJ31477.1 PadR family transcriptional regulator [Mycobacterium colombiense]